jgi:integrase
MLPMTTRQFTRAVHAAAAMAKIKKRVTPHTLRHYVSFLTMSGTLGLALGFPANSPVTGDIVLAPSLSPA